MDIESHLLLDARVFTTTFARPLGETPTDLLALLSLDASAPFKSDEAVREAVRALLRHGGFKPAGRSKPASEYLLRAVSARAPSASERTPTSPRLRSGLVGSINACVDVCNIVSLHSGLPISVVDLAKAAPPFRIAIAPAGAAYVFNASGQSIDLGGLVCLHDADGPCANAVKDAQRTKTDAATTRTLTVIWSTTALPGLGARVETWYRDLLHSLGAETKDGAP